MTKLQKPFADYFPELRERQEGETTPEYLNYLSDTIRTSHAEVLKLSPFHEILEIFESKKPLDLPEIRAIFDVVKKLQNN